jgi:hypothetical protein
VFFQVIKVDEEPAKLLFGNAATEVLDAKFEFDVTSVSLESALFHSHFRVAAVARNLLVRIVFLLEQLI